MDGRGKLYLDQSTLAGKNALNPIRQDEKGKIKISYAISPGFV